MPASELVALLGSENRTPTIVPNTADANNFGSDTTPTIEFTATDEDGDDLRYEIEIANDSLLYTTIPEIRSSSQNSGTTGTDLNVSVPAGAQVGDKIIIAAVANGQTTIVDNNGSTPFTEDVNDYQPNPTNGITISFFSRVLQAGDPTTFHFTSGASGRWAIIAICPKGSQYDVSPNTANAANVDDSSAGSINAPAITVANKSIHIVVATWDTSNIGTISTPSGYTLLQNANGGGEPLHASYKYFATGGSTGAVTCDNSEFGARIAISFSIKSKTTVYLDKVSGTDSGFANTVSGGDTDPFNSGEKVSFTVQAGDALPAGTYYWRARAKDPSGSENWSDWTTARSFSISSGTAANDSRAAKASGSAQSNASRSAKTTGKDSANASRAAKTTGSSLSNSSRSAKTSGVDTAIASRAAHVTGSDSINGARSAKATGVGGGNDNRAVKTIGVDTSFSARNANTTGKNGSIDSRSAKVLGYSSASGSMSAKAVGKDYSLDSRWAKLTGKDSAFRGVTAKTQGKSSWNDARSAKLSGKDSSYSSRAAEVTGKDQANRGISAKTKGSLDVGGNISAEVVGKDLSAGSVHAKLTGKDSAVGNRNVATSGKELAYSGISVSLRGQSIIFELSASIEDDDLNVSIEEDDISASFSSDEISVSF